MTGASAPTDNVAFLLLRDLREGVTTRRIADLDTVQSEIDAAMIVLNSKQPPKDSSHINDLIETLVREIGSLHDKVSRCETKLADFQHQAKALKEDTTQIVTHAEACGLLVEQQQKENAKVLAAMEATKTTAPPRCVAPVPPPADPILCQATSRVAVVSFPGGPRTVTIHPPGSPNYQTTVRDDKGEVIIDFRRTKPLRREGAFRSPIEEIDWQKITRVCGRGPEQPGAQALPPSPRWPDRSQPYIAPPPRHPSQIIARQRQLAASLHTDAFGRLQPPEYLVLNARSPSLPTGMSSLASLPDSLPCSSGWRDSTVSPSMPPSPLVGRGKKRVRSEDDEGTPVAAEAHKKGTRSANPRMIKREVEDEDAPEVKRKRLRSPPSWEGVTSANRSLSRTHSSLDLTRTA